MESVYLLPELAFLRLMVRFPDFFFYLFHTSCYIVKSFDSHEELLEQKVTLETCLRRIRNDKEIEK